MMKDVEKHHMCAS